MICAAALSGTAYTGYYSGTGNIEHKSDILKFYSYLQTENINVGTISAVEFGHTYSIRSRVTLADVASQGDTF